MNKKIKIFTTILCIVAISGCTDGFEEMNKNPNAFEIGGIEPAGLIETLLLSSSNSLASDMTYYATEIAQVSSKSGNVREEQAYNLSDQDFLGRWNLFYGRANIATHMKELAEEQDDLNYQAIGLIMKVYYMAQCTDLFGSIAYSEALKASEQILRPRIESQQEVYTFMMEDLETANALINVNLVKPFVKAERDRLYGGDMARWKKFANTLHLRLLMRVSGRNDAFSPTVAQRIKTIVDNPDTYPIFTSNADNAAVKFDASATYYRNNYNTASIQNQNTFNDAKLSTVFLDLTVYNYDTGDCDPRLKIWGKPALQQARDYKWYGAIPAGNKDRASSEGSYWTMRHWETLVRDDNPNMLMDYAELLFIKAEAAFNGWISGNAKDYYEAAVTASCQYWNEFGKYARFPDQSGATAPVNITAADIAYMLTQPKSMYDGSLERIQKQKWVSLFWVVGYEMYNEMRRTGYPDVALASRIWINDRTNGQFIRRFGYPLIAIANNNANYQEAILDQKGSVDRMSGMTLPVWWSGEAVARDQGNPWPHAFRTPPHKYEEDIYEQ